MPRISAARPAPARPPPRRSGWSRSPTCGPGAGPALGPAPHRTGETTLAAHLELADGPGDLDLADRGFPEPRGHRRQAQAGKHFAWRISSSWTLRRSGQPLPDGTWKAKITWRGRTYKVRVIEYHIDQVLDLPPGPPPPTAPRRRGPVRPRPGRRRRRRAVPAADGTIRVEVSETVTIITSLMDTETIPARDIAELYGMRWASQLVDPEEKQTLAAGRPITAPTPAGACRMAIATVAAHQALRITGAGIAATPRAELPGSAPPRCAPPSPPASAPGKAPTVPRSRPRPPGSSAATSPRTRCGSSPPGGPAGITRASPSRRSGPARAATWCPPPPGCTCCPCPATPCRIVPAAANAPPAA